MPRISSTSCISGTGFMKCMPMNLAGRSVTAASRVMEIDEVLEQIRAAGFSFGQRAQKMRPEEHTFESQPLIRISYADFRWKKKNAKPTHTHIEYKSTYHSP